MARFDAFSRRELRRLRREWLKRNRGPVAIFTLCMVAALAMITLALGWSPGARWRDYLLGATHIGMVAIWWQMLNTSFLAHDRLAIGHVRGAWGEENTREELKRARKKKVVWDWVDSIDFTRGDLDHVVVTRRGGLVALDSKWRSQVDRMTIDEMGRSAQKAKLRAEALTRTLLTGERGKRRARVQPVAVTPAVVLWGAAQHEVPDGSLVRDGVHFVAGRHLLDWLSSLEHDAVDKAAAEDLIRRLERFRSGTQRVT